MVRSNRGKGVTRKAEPTTYQELVASLKPHAIQSETSESQLDKLLAAVQERERKVSAPDVETPVDPVQVLREKVVRDLIPVFVELVEKYSSAGISMQMDASNLLEGGREIAFEFGRSDFRIQLQGTVTNDAIAFHEIRNSQEVQGQLMAGPMLRLRHLDASSFREFVCDRLAVLLRFAVRRR